MRNISTKADNVGDTLPASDFNANLRSELQNVVTSAGFTLDPEGGPDTDVEMFGKAITRYVNAGQYYQDSGTANNYVLARVGNLKQLTSYIDGTIVVFKAGNANTGASTINVDSLGAKALRNNSDVALVGGEITSGGYVIARYRSSTDRFEIVNSQSESAIPLPSTANPYQSPQVNSDGDGYNLIGPVYGFKNKFINPWFDFWQRGGELGGTAINITSSDEYSADRYVVIFDGTADVDIEQVSLGAAIKIGNRWVTKGLRVTVNTNSGNSYLRLCQRIEYVTSLVDHAAVLSSFIQGSGNFTVPVRARQNFGTGGSSDVVTNFASDLAVTSSMQELLTGVTIPDVSGKTIVDDDSFLSIEYDLINLAAADYVIIPFHQFELGENQSAPEYRPKTIDEDLTKRYYLRLNQYYSGRDWGFIGRIRTTANTMRASWPTWIQQRLRANPSVSHGAGVWFYNWGDTATGTVTITTSSDSGFTGTLSSAHTGNTPITVGPNSADATSQATFDAEL